MTAPAPAPADRFDSRRAARAAGLLGEFNAAGVLAAADVHVASRLGALAGERDETVILAAALAVRGPRLGHVHVDLATIASTATVDGGEEPGELAGLPWPAPDGWVERVAASELVGEGGPLRLVGSRLYLDRYWREECQVAEDLVALGGDEVGAIRVADGLSRLFGDGPADARQRLAAEAALRRRLVVIAGGPGTGKTTTVGRIVALLLSRAAAAGAPPLIGLAAPTGKAAARLEQAVHEEAGRLDVGPEIRETMLGLSASTLHRLLGWRPDSRSRFRHNRSQRLPHDVVIVDETSMVSLSLMARLVEAIRPDARLVLVGDPAQLASVEAGAVLGDIVGPPGGADAAGPLAGAIVVLDRVHRFGPGIARLAAAIRRGDADETLATLRDAPDGVEWLGVDPAASEGSLDEVRGAALAAWATVTGAARAGQAAAALAALGRFRVLCAHRGGPHGAASWNAAIEGWVAAAAAGQGRWYVGRPVLVVANDYELHLYNGDTGVVVADADGGRPSVAFERRDAVLAFSPTRLGAVETAYAMTIHKSQGSQFETAAVLLPPPGSAILTRELLYTAVTRARRRLIVVGIEESIRVAVGRPVARASGLGERLWGATLG